MARYLVTDGSHFTPLTYEEMVAPIKVADAAHAAVQDAYDKMSMDTQALRDYISDSEDDSDALDRYNTYMSRLEAVQNNLYQRGISAQTRRELAAARNSFAADILPVQRSIETRQSDSADFWKAVHDNPDVIYGTDPMILGLNKYLKNINVGKQWFSYIGKQFASEIGAAAKARAQEFRRNVRNVKEVPGYITRIAQGGATNIEVDQAVEAARNNTWQKLPDGPVKFLAETVAGSIKGTGAVRGENISDKQYDRFFDYARLGLTQSIQDPDVKDFNDYEWIKEHTKQGGKKDEVPGQPYSLDEIGSFFEGDTAKSNNQVISKYYVNPFEKPIVYKNNDGSIGQIRGQQDADAILSSFGFYDVADKYNIDDPDNLPYGKQWTLPDGREVRLERRPGGGLLGRPSYDLQVKENGVWVDDQELEEELYADIDKYKQAYNEFIANNNGQVPVPSKEEYSEELNKIGRQHLVESWGITDPDNIKNKQSWVTPSGQEIRINNNTDITGWNRYNGITRTVERKVNGKWEEDAAMSDVLLPLIDKYQEDKKQLDLSLSKQPANPDVRNIKSLAISPDARRKIYSEGNLPEDLPIELAPYFMNVLSRKGEVSPATIAASTSWYKDARNNYKNLLMTAFGRGSDENGVVPKGSQYALHKVNGWNISEEPINKLEDVFGPKKELPIDEVTVYPEDVLNDWVRIMVNHQPYAVRPFMLGQGVESVIKRLQEPFTMSPDGRHQVVLDKNGVVSYMMKPLIDPVSAWRMSPEEQKMWLFTILGTGHANALAPRDPSTGKLLAATRPIDVIMDEGLQNTLRTAVTQFINDLVADPRDNMEQNGMQRGPASSSDPTGYNDYYNYLMSQQ